MTKLLEKAFAEASKLSDQEQEAFASFLLEELTSEKRWTDAFARSQDKLASLAAEAIEEFRQGRTVPFRDNRDLAHD
jgi:hypothetical protein